jgi:hypothetical protein
MNVCCMPPKARVRSVHLRLIAPGCAGCIQPTGSHSGMRGRKRQRMRDHRPWCLPRPQRIIAPWQPRHCDHRWRGVYKLHVVHVRADTRHRAWCTISRFTASCSASQWHLPNARCACSMLLCAGWACAAVKVVSQSACERHPTQGEPCSKPDS